MAHLSIDEVANYNGNATSPMLASSYIAI